MSKVLLFVHGAGKTDPNYALEPLAAITLLLGAEPLCVPVYYADIGNVGWPLGIASVQSGDRPPTAAEPPRITRFKAAFAAQVQARSNVPQDGDQAVSVNELSAQDVANLIATEVNQIAGYLFNPMVYNQIQSRMYGGLNKAAQLGDSIVIASHSLGTLIAFDGLRAMGAGYNVSTFFTLGSPLAKLRRIGNRSPDLGAITYAHVSTWLNLYDTTDPLADSLGPAFPLPGYRLRDVFVDIASAPIASHDYFPNPEVLSEIAKALK